MSAREPLEFDRTMGLTDAAPVVGLVIGELVGIIGAESAPIVRWNEPGGPRTCTARSVVALCPSHIGRQLALLFENADASRPVVIGLLQPAGALADPVVERVTIETNDERVVVAARQRVELRCGAASITLDRDGKVFIRGVHIVSHAEGVNRIRGGAVHLN